MIPNVGAGYGTWEARERGELPRVKNDLVSCLTPKYGEREWVATLYENKSIFHLPGQGEQTNDRCGQWVHPLRCPNHTQATLEGKVHDNFVATHSCHKPDCPVCYESWASRQAETTADKLIQSVGLWKKAGLKLGRIDHVVFSPPQELAKELIRTKGGYQTLKSTAIEMFKKAGMVGGAFDFHPFRQNDSREPNFNPDIPEGAWYESPHFHVVGCGYLMRSDNFYELTKWAYKKMSRRETVKGTIKYTLTHCGISEGFQAITYFGIFSNNKVIIEKEWMAEEPIKCQACGESLHEYGMIETDNGLEVDYNDDKGVYIHKVKHRLYKIRDAVLKAYRDKLEAEVRQEHNGFIKIDDRPLIATKDRIKTILRLIEDGC